MLIFFLAFFLDFFELSFIVVPVLAPIADKMGIDLIWFGVLLAVNMQTSFLHPPFGFALFYLRSVAPEKPYVDHVTGKTMAPVTTMQIYKGAIPFLLLQLTMVGVLIAFPGLVTGNLDKQVKVDMKAVGAQMMEQLNQNEGSDFNAAPPVFDNAAPPGPAGGASAPTASAPPDASSGAVGEDIDPMKAIQDSLGKK